MIHGDQHSFSSFLLNLHHLPKLKYLEIRSSKFRFDEPVGDSLDWGLLIKGGAREVVVELGAGLNGYLDQLERFFFKSSRRFKARVIFPVKVNGLDKVCCESFLI